MILQAVGAGKAAAVGVGKAAAIGVGKATATGSGKTSIVPVAGENKATTATPTQIDHSKDIARYEKEKAEIKKEAEEDEAVSEAHLAKHVPLSRAVTAFQVAIAISAIAVLTRRKNLWYMGLGLTAIGVFFLIVGILP
jgi:hypothetical protein